MKFLGETKSISQFPFRFNSFLKTSSFCVVFVLRMSSLVCQREESMRKTLINKLYLKLHYYIELDLFVTSVSYCLFLKTKTHFLLLRYRWGKIKTILKRIKVENKILRIESGWIMENCRSNNNNKSIWDFCFRHEKTFGYINQLHKCWIKYFLYQLNKSINFFFYLLSFNNLR